MNVGRIAALVLVTSSALTPAWGAEAYGVLDNFDSTVIDGERWFDQERVRTLTGTALRHIQRDVGDVTSNSGGVAYSFSTMVARPTPVTQLRAIVRVGSVDLTGCPANTGALTRVRARLLGTFFNTGTRVLGSNVGDVLAQAWLVRSSTSTDGDGVMRVEGWVGICRDATCQGAGQIGSLVSLGTATVGQSVTLAIEWDRATKTFTFIRDGGASSGSVTYALSDTQEPSVMFKGVGTRNEAAHCTAQRTSAAIDATFDTVSVNAKAKP